MKNIRKYFTQMVKKLLLYQIFLQHNNIDEENNCYLREAKTPIKVVINKQIILLFIFKFNNKAIHSFENYLRL